MAQLHRGVLGLPHCAALIALTFGLAPTETWAQEEIHIDDIVRWAADLRSDDGTVRRRAYERLSHLPESALPAIAERIEQTRRQIVPAQDGREALRAFRHAVGSRRADDMVDIAPGVLPVLEERRSREFGRTAERLLLLRSLEAMGTVEAQRRIADIFSLTNEMWRWEQRRVVHRMGVRLLPGLILARGHHDRGVRLWARGHIRKLGMKDPANALRVEDPELLAQIINAYAEVKDLDTMPLILSYVGHEDRRIREAARAAFESFGRNGIWQLREGIRKQLGHTPDARWGWRRTMRELFDGLDERRLAPYSRRLDQAQEALRDGDHERAKELLDGLLRDAPRPPRATEVAAAYAEIATALDEPRLLRRACWLAPEALQADAWRARLMLIEAEADRARGVVDVEAYRFALEHDSKERTRALAREVMGDDEAPKLEGDPADGGEPAWLVALLLLVAATASILAWRCRSDRPVGPRCRFPIAVWRRMLDRHRSGRPNPPAPRAKSSTSLGSLLLGCVAQARGQRSPSPDSEERPPTDLPAPLSLTQLVLGATAAGTTVQMPNPNSTEACAQEGGLCTDAGALGDLDTEPGLFGLPEQPEADLTTNPGVPPELADEPSPTPEVRASKGPQAATGIAALLLNAPGDTDTLPGAPAPR